MFVIEGKHFHILNQLNDPKDYSIKIGDNIFSYSQAQIVFIILNAFIHFDSSTKPFIIETTNSEEMTVQSLVSAFESLDSLFKDQTEIIINENNVNQLTFLAQQIGNPLLLYKCDEFIPGHPQILNLLQNTLQFFIIFNFLLYSILPLNFNIKYLKLITHYFV
jgi:hypothetical protein